MGKKFWVSATLCCLFALALVWQAARFTDLKQKADDLDYQEEKWSAENRKLEADIATLMSRQRTSDIAASMGLVKIDPADRLRIVVTSSDQTAGAQSTSPQSAPSINSKGSVPVSSVNPGVLGDTAGQTAVNQNNTSAAQRTPVPNAKPDSAASGSPSPLQASGGGNG